MIRSNSGLRVGTEPHIINKKISPLRANIDISYHQPQCTTEAFLDLPRPGIQLEIGPLQDQHSVYYFTKYKHTGDIRPRSY